MKRRSRTERLALIGRRANAPTSILRGPAGKRRELRERLIALTLGACAALTTVTTIGLVALFIYEMIGLVSQLPLDPFVWSSSASGEPGPGLWRLLGGTVLVASVAVGLALPLGLLIAIWLCEFAPPRAQRIFELLVALLASIPTVVYGYFALVYITPALAWLVDDLAQFNALSASVVIGLMIVPTISALSQQALRAVPDSVREGAFALGARKLPTIFRLVLPSALPGIAAAAVLSLARAMGETMVVAIAAGHPSISGHSSALALDLRAPMETLSSVLISLSAGQLPVDSPAYRGLFVVGAALLLLTMATSAISQRLVRRLHRGAWVR